MHATPAVPGFNDAVRDNIITLLGISFQRIHKSVLGSYLALQPAELDKLVGGLMSWREGRGWRCSRRSSTNGWVD